MKQERGKHSYIPDTPSQIRLDYLGGMTYRAIAEKYRIDPRTARRYVQNNLPLSEYEHRTYPSALDPYKPLIRKWLEEPGRAVLSVVHDLSLARRYGTHAVLMDHGKSVSQGEIREVMAPDTLQQVYGMNVYEWMREMLSQWQE